MQVARSAGRKLVTAPYFTYLDDDDELIAGALQSPLAWLDQHPLDHAIITNGLFIRSGGRLDPSSHLAMHINDPAMGLLSECWLSPGAFVFRTASISQSVCSADWGQLEWSQLAFELCATRAKIHFMDVATVRYSDTPGSMSKQISHHEANLKLLRSIRSDERLAPQVRSGADRKYLRSLHNMVPLYLASGDRAGAWRCHLGSLRPPYTLKFLLFTRKLLWPRQRHQ